MFNNSNIKWNKYLQKCFNIKLESRTGKYQPRGVLYFPQSPNCTLPSRQDKKRKRKEPNLPFVATCVFFFFFVISPSVLHHEVDRREEREKKVSWIRKFDAATGRKGLFPVVTFRTTYTVANRIKSNRKWSISVINAATNHRELASPSLFRPWSSMNDKRRVCETGEGDTGTSTNWHCSHQWLINCFSRCVLYSTCTKVFRTFHGSSVFPRCLLGFPLCRTGICVSQWIFEFICNCKYLILHV